VLLLGGKEQVAYSKEINPIAKLLIRGPLLNSFDYIEFRRSTNPHQTHPSKHG
jgi:hypothetical protein